MENKHFLQTHQPAPTFEVDFRGWQSYGQYGCNLAIITLKDDFVRLVFTSQDFSEKMLKTVLGVSVSLPVRGDYVTGPVKKVATFGKRDTFGIYEGEGFGSYAKCRYFVDTYQAKQYRDCESTQDLINHSKPISDWHPTDKHRQEWIQQYPTNQGTRIESVRPIMPKRQ